MSARTVNRNDLVAIASILGWATSVNGKKTPQANAAFGIKVEPPKKVVAREKMFRAAEISAILRLARSVKLDQRYPARRHPGGGPPGYAPMRERGSKRSCGCSAPTSGWRAASVSCACPRGRMAMPAWFPCTKRW